jgi:hypothetical protein
MYNKAARQSHEFTCDYGRDSKCHGEVTFDDVDFSIATAMLKDEHWQSHKNALDEWEHTCPACVEHKKREAFRRFKDSIK